MSAADLLSATLPAQPAPAAPPADAFPVWPLGWSVFGNSREIDAQPIARDLFGRRIVVYRTANGAAAAMNARCWHMGADLGDGCVAGDRIRCPFHGWEFDAGGRCAHVPEDDDIPPQARQTTYALAERGGIIFVFPAARAPSPAPFFDDVDPADLVAAEPFEFVLDCPWWLVGTNAFDVQHFRGAHDRRLTAPPTVTSPHPAARRIVAQFDICGTSWRDRLTRVFSGPCVTMDVTVWSGTLVFVAARFRRTTSFGLVDIQPLVEEPNQTRVRVHIFVQRRFCPLDRIDVAIRRSFIRAFLEPDARLLHGAVYHPHRLIEADRLMIDYLNWLAPVTHGRFNAEEIT